MNVCFLFGRYVQPSVSCDFCLSGMIQVLHMLKNVLDFIGMWPKKAVFDAALLSHFLLYKLSEIIPFLKSCPKDQCSFSEKGVELPVGRSQNTHGCT